MGNLLRPTFYVQDPGADLSPTLLERYSMNHRIHAGPHGDVWYAVDKATAKIVAVKVYHTDIPVVKILNVANRIFDVPQVRNGELQHYAICKCHGIFVTRTRVAVVMEYLTGPSVYQWLQDESEITEFDCSQIFKQVLQALRYMHRQNIGHRDIRLEQLLFSEKATKTVKLTELVHCVRYRKRCGRVQPLHEPKPSVLRFAPPEVIQKGTWTTASDMWMAGCLLFELLCYFMPRAYPAW